MRLAVLSDLHLEFHPYQPVLEGDVDAVILAGDIAPGTAGVVWAAAAFPEDIPVFLVPGNHEYFHEDTDTLPAELQAAAKATKNVTVLDRGEVWIRKPGASCRILGATLWTDFALEGAGTVPQRKVQAHAGMICYRAIRRGGRPLTPEDTAAFHAHDLAFLIDRLGEDVTIPTIVVTHHAPSAGSIHEKYAGSSLNAAFASDLDRLILAWGPRIWVHGHVHSPWDYRIGETRVVANPLGYPREIYTDTASYRPLYIEI